MIRPVLTEADPRLRRRCAPVGRVTDETRGLIGDLTDTMRAMGGPGLAAPQIGVLSRVFVLDAPRRNGGRGPLGLVDPRIVAASREVATGIELCLSIPGRTRSVRRPSWVALSWTDAEGERREGVFEGLWAACVQHKTDHLEGRLMLDHRAAPHGGGCGCG